MSNNYFRRYHRNLALFYVKAILIGIAVMAVLSFVQGTGVVYSVLKRFGGYGLAGRIHYHINEIYLLLIAVYAVLLLVISQIRTSRHIKKIMIELDHVLDPDKPIGRLPRHFSNIEEKFVGFRRKSEYERMLYQEIEQRKNDLVVYLAHDLKTPLTSLTGYLKLLNDGCPLTPEATAKYLGISLRKAEQLDDLINEFFEITRYSLQEIHLVKQEVDVSILVTQLAEEFTPAFDEHGIRCFLSVQKGMTACCDADKMVRVFGNVLKNAISYSYENSEIRICGEQSDSQLKISVENQGNTIPKEQQDMIFEKFYRLDSSRSSKTGNAGLGLAIAKQILELHQGSIGVVSENNCTTFTIIIPVKLR